MRKKTGGITRREPHLSESRAEGGGKPPTSRDNSLVVVLAARGMEKPPTSHHDSLVLVRAGVEGRGSWWPPFVVAIVILVYL
jgi:hypothetical protein